MDEHDLGVAVGEVVFAPADERHEGRAERHTGGGEAVLVARRMILVEVLGHHAAVDDAGLAVNPMIIHGQTHGGIAQGVGQALWEHVVYDRASGQMLSASFMDYAMPRASLLPSYTAEFIEIPTPSHPLGIRPAGEGGTTGALAAVANAVLDALSDYDVDRIDMPLTSEKVWRAINGR